MNISLTRELEEFVTKKVKSGTYHSASEVIRDSLRLLVERDHLSTIRREELRNAVREGLASGEPIHAAEVFREVRQKITKQRKKGT